MSRTSARPGVLLLLLLPGAAAAQQEGELAGHQPASGVMVSVIPGERYAAGPLHRTFFGDRYRDLWTAPVEVPVLDLQRFAGGLVPEERGGGQQTRSLHFTSGDGREFTFRSLDKDPTKAVPEPFRGTVIHRLVQDATSAMQPGGALVAPVLLEAAGVLHVAPQLVVMPDDPGLGEHRADFAGLLGMIEGRPEDGFGGADEIESSEEVFAALRASAAHRVDPAAFLTARLVDHLLGDWDRHADQWRWAGFEREGRTAWHPIPRDRDQALARYDGVVTGFVRKHNPKLTTFGPRYPSSMAGFTWNARALDRVLLSPLDAAAFDSVAAALQARLTDSVIAAAVERMPAAHRRRRGEWTAAALRRRRDDLREQARRFYRYLATDVDVWATDAADRAEARWEDGGLRVRVWTSAETEPWFDRHFVAGESDAVRLHLREGADSVLLAGEGSAPRLHIVREPQDGIAGPAALPVRLHDHRPEPRPEDADEEAAQEESADKRAHRDWGSASAVGPHAAYDPDLGLLLGGRARWTDYDFRHDPYRARTGLSAVYATAADGLRIELTSELRRTDPRTRLGLLVRASEIEVVRFSGLGNETLDAGDAADVSAWRLTVAPAFERTLSPSLRGRIGPVLDYTTTDRELGLVGASGFGRLGVAGDLLLATPRVDGTLGGSLHPPAWSPTGTYGVVHGELRARLPLAGPTLAARLGGRRVWGPFPYDDAAFLGGARTLRGYDHQRFAGDAMLYGGLELRVAIARVLREFVPTRIGLIALGDAGRVWAAGTDSERVHAAAGGGVWLEFFEQRNTLSLVYARGREGGHWYFQLGLPY